MNTYAIILSAVTLSFGSACAATPYPPAIEPESTPVCMGRLDKMAVSPAADSNASPTDTDNLDLVSQSALPTAIPTPMFASPAINAQTRTEGPVEPAMIGIGPSAEVVFVTIGKASAAVTIGSKAPAAGVSPIVPMQPAS